MTTSDPKTAPQGTAGTILSRFAHLLSAQGVEGIFATTFFLYLAWTDKLLFGEVSVALAVGVIVSKIVLYGLYYPLVKSLGEADTSQAPELLNRTNIIKLGLFFCAMMGTWAWCFSRGYSTQLLWIVLLSALGSGLEGIAETYFADLRVKGLQKTEAKIRVASAISSYGYGFVTTALGAHPVVIACFRVIPGIVRLSLGLIPLLKVYRSAILAVPQWADVWGMLRGSTIFALFEIFSVLYNKTNIFFLEKYTGIKGVAAYSAAYNLVDPVSILASEQLLAWVIFPILASLWWNSRQEVPGLVRRTAQWLMVVAFPIMFLLHTESDILIHVAYRGAYPEAEVLPKYLVWTILLSFESNLFIFLMMVAGGIRILVGFCFITLLLNVLCNQWLVSAYGLTGGCLVIVFTKMLMTLLTLIYCQLTVGIFKAGDALFPLLLAGGSFVLFVVIEPVITWHPAVALTEGVYLFLLWKLGQKYLGRFPERQDQ